MYYLNNIKSNRNVIKKDIVILIDDSTTLVYKNKFVDMILNLIMNNN
jgi:hypothetical protein